jgi:hypothetical protein
MFWKNLQPTCSEQQTSSNSRRKHLVLLQCLQLPTAPQGVTFKKTAIPIFINVRLANRLKLKPEDSSLLEWDAVSFEQQLPTFRRIIVPLRSGSSRPQIGIQSFATSATTWPMPQHHMPQDLGIQRCYCWKLKSHKWNQLRHSEKYHGRKYASWQ